MLLLLHLIEFLYKFPRFICITTALRTIFPLQNR